MSSDLETLQGLAARLQAIADRCKDIPIRLAECRTELDRTVRLLRQVNNETEGRRQNRRRAAFAWALFGGMLGGLLAGWVAQAFLAG